MSEAIRCPMRSWGQRCQGMLELIGDFETTLGTINGIDLNTHNETYKCPLCNALVSREFKWHYIKPVKKGAPIYPNKDDKCSQ